MGMASNVKLNLEAFGCQVNLITNRERIRKTRIIHQETNQQMMRIDEDIVVSPIKNSEVKSAFVHSTYDAIVVSDYNKWFLTTDDLKVISQNFKGPVFIDTKKKDLFTEKNTYFKINQKEFESLITMPEDANLIVTLGSDGAKYNNKIYPSQQVKVYDVVGAGDAFLAGLVYGFLSYNDMECAVVLANKVASVVVQYPGTYSITEQDIKRIWYGSLLGG